MRKRGGLDRLELLELVEQVERVLVPHVERIERERAFELRAALLHLARAQLVRAEHAERAHRAGVERERFARVHDRRRRSAGGAPPPRRARRRTRPGRGFSRRAASRACANSGWSACSQPIAPSSDHAGIDDESTASAARTAIAAESYASALRCSRASAQVRGHERGVLFETAAEQGSRGAVAGEARDPAQSEERASVVRRLAQHVVERRLRVRRVVLVEEQLARTQPRRRGSTDRPPRRRRTR